MIDPLELDEEGWEEYYNDVSTLDDLLMDAEERVSDACEFITAFTQKFSKQVVGFLRTRWLTPSLQRGQLCFSEAAPFESCYALVNVSVDEGYHEVSPKVAGEANAMAAEYRGVVGKLQRYGKAAMQDWFDTYTEILSKTLVEQVYEHGWEEKDEDEPALPVTDAIVFFSLDDYHYIRIPFSEGKFDNKNFVAVELSQDVDLQWKKLVGFGEEACRDVYVVDNASETVHMESVLGYVRKCLLKECEEESP